LLYDFGFNAENFMKIRQGMTSGECVENKWFKMKYIGKYLSVEILLTHECTYNYYNPLANVDHLTMQRNMTDIHVYTWR
jgi:hypothetical protein